MRPLKALMIILILDILMLVVPFLAGSSITVFHLPLNVFVLWVLYLSVIPTVWILIHKVKT
ncbi:hypothetical protein GCM10008983_02140 [Lentibacillus halophilus]|uniref:Uncharacterized protein n=1 Tax=Lentibacillus halophilus TaxID=295065 RepID=A0ABN0Z1Z5_9BACI